MLSFSVNPPQTKVVKFRLNSKVSDIQVSDKKQITVKTEDEKTMIIKIDEESVTITCSRKLSAVKPYKFEAEDY